MNLFSHYQHKIFKSIKKLEKKNKILIPEKIKSFTVELPPKNQNADISCNASMVLAKFNNTSPEKLANVIKNHLLNEFSEFKDIEIAKPGFLNIYFHISFWRKHLININKLEHKYGSNQSTKKKI